MSTTIVLMLAGPRQAWGVRSRFVERRDTGSMPSRSGIIGLIGACLGHSRDHPLTWAQPLTITARADRPGQIETEFQTIGGWEGGWLPQGTKSSVSKNARMGYRSYLEDAAFTVTIEGEPDLMARIAEALRAPRYGPFLGRRACPPGLPLLLGEVEMPGRDVLARLPALRRKHRDATTMHVPAMLDLGIVNDPTSDIVPSTVRCLVRSDADTYASEVVNDIPLSFREGGRQHATRGVIDDYVDVAAAGTGLEGWAAMRNAILNGLNS